MKKILNTNKLLISLLIAMCMLLWSFVAVFSIKSYADSSYYGTNTISVTNGKFDDFTKNTEHLPYKIDTGWNNIVGLNSTTAYAGIVDTGSNFETNGKFGLPVNPSVDSSITNSDTNILMIKSKGNETKYGFESNELTLAKAKYYAISVRAKTGLRDTSNKIINETVATGSIYTTLSNEDENNFLNVSTGGQWQTYTFFVETDTFSDAKFNIQLRLGNKKTNSNGVVFYDQVEVVEIANIDYYSAKAANKENSKFISLNEDITTSFNNSSFEKDFEGWNVKNNSSYASIKTKNSINEELNLFEKTSNVNYADNFVYDGGKSLLILNRTKDYTSISSKTNNTIEIAQHGYYKLSFLIKTGSLSSGGLNVKLSQVAETDAISKEQTGLTSSSSTLKQYNNFSLVEFYIRGNVYKTEKVSISFDLGTEKDPVSGWAIIDNIVLEKISASEYSSNSSSDAKVLDLSSKATSTATLANSSFDFVSTNSKDTYPMAPQNWSGENSALSGVIRVKAEYFNVDAPLYGLSSTDNPGPNSSYDIYVENNIKPNILTTDENVLMVRSNNANDAYFKSENKTINANSSEDKIVKFEVGVKTIADAKAFIKLVDKDSNTIAVLENISSNADWTKYIIFVKNGVSSIDVNFVLGVKGNENNNYAFFDHVKYTDNVESDMQTIVATQNSVFVDLKEDSFYSATNIQTELNVYQAANYSTYLKDELKDSAMYNGVVNSHYLDGVKLRENANDKNILIFSNVVKSYQSLNTNYTYSLTKDNYYEFSVWVKTNFEGTTNAEKAGAIFEILTLDKENNTIIANAENKLKFYGISTSTEENNGWVKYSIYAVAESDQSVKIILGLGTQENATQGTVYFDDLKVSSISQDEYAQQTANNTTIITKAVEPTTSNNGNDENTSTESSAPTDFNFFALFSSIILAVALVFAIAGYLIRRIPKKKAEAVVEKSSYSKTPRDLDKKEVKRELKEMRETKSQNIKAELDALKDKRNSLQEEYEKKYEEEKDSTERENLYKNHTKKINKLTKEIDYLESALVYVNDNVNIKNMENLEIKKRQKQINDEFEKLNKLENDDKK
ncbi:MAG: hypothetical protein IJD48_00720 [Clostridia bacterium]|nr:hypothetical protein [Clostridia bacterium]